MHHRTTLATLLLAVCSCLPLAATAQSSAVLKGEVLEVQNVDGYTYLRLKTQEGEVWAAVTTVAVKKGAVVSIANPATMQNFESKTLKRRFDKIVFGSIVPAGAMDGMPRPGPTAAAPAAATMLPTGPAHPGTAAPAAGAQAAAVKVEKVDKATGPDARTVAELVKGKAGLKDKAVVVRARVVKVNNGIMGKNWLHLQDGSGTAQDGSHDVMVTTQETAAVGDVVTVRGTVRTDVTVGAGYTYAVMVEDAKLRK